MGIFSFLNTSKKNKAVFCGLDSSGKSTIISFLQTGTFVKHTPTMGKKYQEIMVEGTKIALFDMGGQSDFRGMWLGETNSASVVVYVIDMADEKRFGEAKEEFNKLLPTIIKNKIKLLILANKFDLIKSSTIVEIIKQLNLTDLENFEIMEISAKTGYGMTDAFLKFYTLLTGEVIEKSVFAKAISLYAKGGNPILLQTNFLRDEEINQQVLEGGFLSAITSFSQMNLSENAMQLIHFNSEENGTFIVAKSPHYMGSLLWTKNLGVKLNESEEALKGLITHLEKNADFNDESDVRYLAKHYLTNLI